MGSSDSFYITGSQIRAARAFLRWSAEDLAARTKLGVATIRRAEAQDGPITLTPANADAIQSAFEAAGIQFIFGNGGGPGVRLRHPVRDNRSNELQSG
jgi:transcriptional regulator with XRE-family HTH domain